MAENADERQWIVEPPGMRRDRPSHLRGRGSGAHAGAGTRDSASWLESLEKIAAEVSGYGGKCPKEGNVRDLEVPLVQLHEHELRHVQGHQADCLRGKRRRQRLEPHGHVRGDGVKASRYNVWTHEEGSDFVYNGMSGASLKLGTGERQAVEGYLAGERDGLFGGAPSEPGAWVHARVGRDRRVAAARGALPALAQRQDASRPTIVTSLGCNFDCPYCFEDKHPSILGAEVEDGVHATPARSDPRPSTASTSVGTEVNLWSESGR